MECWVLVPCHFRGRKGIAHHCMPVGGQACQLYRYVRRSVLGPRSARDILPPQSLYIMLSLSKVDCLLCQLLIKICFRFILYFFSIINNRRYLIVIFTVIQIHIFECLKLFSLDKDTNPASEDKLASVPDKS